MAVNEEYLAYVLEQLRAMGTVHARRMFGGAGLYCQERMFGLIADDTVYLRPHESTRAQFARAGMPPFSYVTATGRRSIAAFRQVPEAVLEDAQELAQWARAALAASPPPRRRDAAGPPSTPRRRRPAAARSRGR
jgi:DNA transformation protein